MKYCPDCGAERQDQDPICPECQFPLKLQLLDSEEGYYLPENQRKSWLRVWTLLRKSGITIETSSKKSLTAHQAWMVLPAIGLIVLLLSMVFSRPLAQWLIPVDPIAVPVDFNQGSSASGNESAGGSTENQIALLKQALQPTDEQGPPPETTVYQEPLRLVSRDIIQEYVDQSTVEITVEGKSGFGTLFLPGGYVLSSSNLLELAFTRVKGTIQSDKSFVQGSRLIEPRLIFQGAPQSDVRLIHRLDTLPLTILKVGIPSVKAPFELNFQDPIAVGAQVWMSYEQSDYFEVESVKISKEMGNGVAAGYELATTLQAHTEGLPVFNEQGQMIGTQLEIDGVKGFIALVGIREKAPVIYRDIHNLLQGNATSL